MRDAWTFAGVRCRAFCVAPPKNDDWSLRDFYAPESAQTRLGQRIGRVLDDLSVRRISILAPTTVDMNAAMVDPEDLTTEITVSNRNVFRRNRTIRADGTWDESALTQKQGHAQSGAGCAIAVGISTNGKVCRAHLARDSMFDRRRIDGGAPRGDESIFHAFARTFRERWGIKPKDVQVFTVFSLDKANFFHEFDEPKHGDSNRRLWQDTRARRMPGEVMEEGTGRLDMGLACEHIGLKEVGFKRVHVRSVLPYGGAYADTRHPDEALRKKRNFQLLITGPA
ncbi:MAG TPA: hypothetical protein VGN56_01635 [Candidatus Paceibacterota bacterium]|nr:hypothetical protein [Candidatus Paceibacterota bacterium]